MCSGGDPMRWSGFWGTARGRWDTSPLTGRGSRALRTAAVMTNNGNLLLALVALAAVLGAVPAIWAVQAIMDRYDRDDVQIWFERHHLRHIRGSVACQRDVETHPPATLLTASVAGTYSPGPAAPQQAQGVPAPAGSSATYTSSGRVAGHPADGGPPCAPDRVRVVVSQRSTP